MAQSSNIGFAKIAMTYLHEEKLYKYATLFGIGQRTGIMGDQGESAGLLRPVNKWSGLSITRIPMGQEVLASPVQLVAAMSVIANGGKLVEPRLTKQVTDETGKIVQVYQPKVVRQVISPVAAREVAEALHQVTVDGTAKAIKIQDPATGNFWSFAGKDGYGAEIHQRGILARSSRRFVHRFRSGGRSRVCLPGDGGRSEDRTAQGLRRDGFGPGLCRGRETGRANHEYSAGHRRSRPDRGPAGADFHRNNPRRPVKLSEILKDVETKSVEGPVDRTIHALRYDSRRVEANDVFFAWKGAKTDGHQYIAEVCDRGAAAVVLENPAFAGHRGPTFIEVKNARRSMADMSANFFRAARSRAEDCRRDRDERQDDDGVHHQASPDGTEESRWIDRHGAVRNRRAYSPRLAHDAGVARPARFARADAGGRLPLGGDGGLVACVGGRAAWRRSSTRSAFSRT